MRHALAALLLAAPLMALAMEPEAAPVLEAREIAGDIPLTGAQYEIAASVPTDGFMAQVTISSPFGEFIASGPGMLDARLDEIRALAALQLVEDDDRFKEAAADTARDTAGNLRQLAENPKETLKGVPEGVGRFFNRTGRTLKTGLQKLGDVREGKLPGVDPDQVSNLPGGTGTAPGAPDASLTESIARAGGGAVVNILGFDKQRRRLAKELGVDPYTTNRVLSQQLDDVTWAAFAGGLGVNVITSIIPGGLILSSSARLSDWVWDTAPGDLRVAIEAQLLEIGATREEVDLFLRHSFYPLSMQTVLAGALEAMDGVAGRAEVLPLALSVSSEGQARFVVQTLDMLRNYHQMTTPLTALQVGGTIVGETAEGRIAVMAPVDVLSWSQTLANFTATLGAETQNPPDLHIAGRATERAREQLVALGWTVQEQSTLAPTAYPVH
jgi:hypothetical protein